jgi:hypothetical protein
MRNAAWSAFAVSTMLYAVAACAQTDRQPRLEHPKVGNPATLSDARAESVYEAIRVQMRIGYMQGGDPVAVAYQGWRRFNRAAYRSQTHGERFVNHYGNDKAAGYGRFEKLAPLPVGAVVIKDSFAVARDGAVVGGPLFMMEKMAAGFESGAGAWRFMMLSPNGSLAGITGGPGDDRVRFCATCHKQAGPEHDYLFFMPKKWRAGG